MRNAFLGILCLILLIQSAGAQTINMDHPLGGSAFMPGASVKINWTNDSAVEHFQAWYTTNPSASCSGSSSSVPCPAQSGNWTCIQSHPYYAQEINWIAPGINSSDVRVRVEGHDPIHSTLVNSCSGTFTIAQSPSPPASLAAITLSASSINLTWSPGAGLVEKYIILRNGTNIANTTQLYHLDAGLPPSMTYEYGVLSHNALGYSGFGTNATNTTLPIPPSITSFVPVAPVVDSPGAARTFTVNTDQAVDVTWHLNSSIVQTNNNVITASYINNSASIGAWNITAIVSNANGTDSQEWEWRVAPSIIISFVSPTDAHLATVTRGWTFVNASVTAASSITSCLLEWAAYGSGSYSFSNMSLSGTANSAVCSFNKTAADGRYVYFVDAFSLDGGFNSSSQRNITLNASGADTSQPSINADVAPEVLNGTDALIFINASDPSGIAGIWAFIQRPDSGNTTINLTNGTQNAYYSDAVGTYTVTIYALDAGGIIGTTTLTFNSVLCITGSARQCGNILSDTGACEFGTQTCANNAWSACTGVIGPANEACNGADDDCDGQVDEGGDCCVTGQTRQCGTDMGACEFGTSTCVNMIWEAACTGGVGPATELCGDAIDNNCNGQVDEDCESPELTCSNNVQDATEDGIDCGGICPAQCNPPSLFGFILIVAGVAVLVVIVLLVAHFKSHGKELTWEEVKKKWTPAGKI